jgi:hypothetical protein
MLQLTAVRFNYSTAKVLHCSKYVYLMDMEFEVITIYIYILSYHYTAPSGNIVAPLVWSPVKGALSLEM